MKVQIFMLKQDDPTKCTAAKLVKFGLAKQIRRTVRDTMILDPFAPKV
ncbi:MAG: ribonuclease P, partial [Thaumarchaeota archaeon]|nr:ribonuclease P [Nitrososphaerota archaeon]